MNPPQQRRFAVIADPRRRFCQSAIGSQRTEIEAASHDRMKRVSRHGDYAS
jgi:hypothetical protein